jgi:L-fuconolactonase
MLFGHPEDPKTMGERIDAHCHLWHYVPENYAWIGNNMGVLTRNYLPADLETELSQNGFDGSVVVQARQTLQETEWLLSLARKRRTLRGVIGWAPIASDSFQADLDGLRENPELKGLRHVVQDEPDDNFLNRPDFNRGISLLANSGLLYEILILERQLSAAIQFVDRHPNQLFVLDHIAKPRIREQIDEPWKSHITEIARRENVFCKLSGMVTEASWLTWKDSDLHPYFDAVLDAFGPSRLMAGSDWPVCLVATTYRKWMQTLQTFIAPLSVPERAMIMGGTAIQLYSLQANAAGIAQ